MNRHQIAARTAAAAVAAVAGAASFEHIASVAMAAGERPWVAYALPAAIDGLIVVGVAALLEDRRAERVPRRSARLAVLVGVVATLAANIASAEPGLRPALVAVAAPVSFLLSVEVLTRTGRKVATEPASARTPVRHAPSERPAAASNGHGRGQAAAKVVTAMAANPDASVAELARLAGVSRSTVRRART